MLPNPTSSCRQTGLSARGTEAEHESRRRSDQARERQSFNLSERESPRACIAPHTKGTRIQSAVFGRSKRNHREVTYSIVQDVGKVSVAVLDDEGGESKSVRLDAAVERVVARVDAADATPPRKR